jgi:pimeloyl-ACP methyl ester carboxylesterase
MWRWIRRILAGTFGLLVICVFAGTVYQAWQTTKALRAFPPPGRLVDVGGHRLHIWCTGSGVPTVLLDTGLGGTAFDWGRVQPAVTAFTHVCSYDRAGMGYSDSGPYPRTSRQIVRELAALLDGSGVRSRVVLVGASIGGWNVRLMASTHEERVAGLVLVDARHENQGEQLAAIGAAENPPAVAHLAPLVAYSGIARLLGIAPGLPPDSVANDVRDYARATRFRSSALVAAASELLNGSGSAAEVRAERRQLDIPVVIVSAGRRGNARTTEVLSSLQRDQLALSKRSCQVIAERSGHGIALTQPEIVVDSIRAIVEAARNVTATPDCDSITQRASERP